MGGFKRGIAAELGRVTGPAFTSNIFARVEYGFNSYDDNGVPGIK